MAQMLKKQPVDQERNAVQRFSGIRVCFTKGLGSSPEGKKMFEYYALYYALLNHTVDVLLCSSWCQLMFSVLIKFAKVFLFPVSFSWCWRAHWKKRRPDRDLRWEEGHSVQLCLLPLCFLPGFTLCNDDSNPLVPVSAFLLKLKN